MRQITNSQKVLLVLLGIISSFFMLEGGLRLGGFIITAGQRMQNRIKMTRKKDYVILCLGESTTQEQWPGFLKEALSAELPELRMTVIDEGLTGTTSFYIAERLPLLVDKYHPDIVVTMMGINDTFNSRVVTDENHPEPSQQDEKERLRIAKLFRLLQTHISARVRKNDLEDQLSQAPALLSESRTDPAGRIPTAQDSAQRLAEEAERLYLSGDFDAAVAAGQKANFFAPRNALYQQQLMTYYVAAKAMAKANLLIHERMIQNPDDVSPARNYAGKLLLEQRFEEAEGLLKERLADNFHPQLVVKLLELYAIKGDFEAYEQLSAQARQSGITVHPYALEEALLRRALVFQLQGQAGKAEERFEAAKMFRMHRPKPGLAKNYNYIKRITKERGIQLVCVEYPVRSVVPLQRMMEPHEGVIFVDSEKVFKERMYSHADYMRYFKDNFGGSFGHCTDEGNRLLAENIAQVLLKEYFGPQGRRKH